MSDPLLLHEPSRWSGLWWLPDNPSDQVAGTLVFDPALGTTLTLIGAFGTYAHPFAALAAIQEVMTYQTIYGFSETGKAISLLRARRGTVNTHMPGMISETWKGLWIVIGAHVPSFETDAFHEAKTGFHGLAEWLDRPPFASGHDNGRPEITLTWTPQAEVDLGRLEDLGLTASAETAIGFQSERLHSTTAHARSAIVLQADAPQSLRWHFKQAAQVNRLAALCIGQHLPLTFMRLGRVAETETPSDYPRAETVEVLFKLNGGPIPLGKFAEPPIYTVTDLLHDNADALARWFAVESELEPTIDLLLTYLWNEAFPTEMGFLLMAQALEVFHRTTAPGVLMKKSDYAKIKTAMVESIPAGTPKAMVDKLKMSLGFANEPSLRERLEATVEGLAPTFGTAPFGFDKVAIGAVADSRNYFTHYPARLKSKALRGAQLYRLTKRFVPLLFTLLFIRLNLPRAAVHRRITSRRDFNYWSQP